MEVAVVIINEGLQLVRGSDPILLGVIATVFIACMISGLVILIADI